MKSSLKSIAVIAALLALSVSVKAATSNTTSAAANAALSTNTGQFVYITGADSFTGLLTNLATRTVLEPGFGVSLKGGSVFPTVAAAVQVAGWQMPTWQISFDAVTATVFEPSLITQTIGVGVDWDIYKSQNPAPVTASPSAGIFHAAFSDIGGFVNVTARQDDLFNGKVSLKDTYLLLGARFKF